MTDVVLDNGHIAVSVRPQVGGTITRVVHRASGLSVLGEVPWQVSGEPLAGGAARDEPEWLTRYTGGWPVLFPNGGDACTVGGVFHGFHGEASITAWAAGVEAQSIVLRRDFSVLPVSMERRISLDGQTVRIMEHVMPRGSRTLQVMWGQHPTFGGDLLAAPFEISCGAARVRSEASYDPPLNPLVAGAQGAWPEMPGKRGAVNLSRPPAPLASLVYLEEFETGWAAIRRLDNKVAALLTWDARLFPCAWAWFELEGTADAPWNGRTRLIGIEPSTTPCALGLAEARRRNAPLLTLEPGREISTSFALTLFTPSGPLPSGPDAPPIPASSSPEFP